MVEKTELQTKKEVAREAFVEGWHRRVGDEELSKISRKAAESVFERWWNRNNKH